jgi:putative membrane protein
MEDTMRGRLLVGTAALVSLVSLAACEDRNTTIAERDGGKVATAPAQPGATGSVAGNPNVSGPTSNTGKAELDSKTRDYVQKAAMGDMFEVESSRLALQRARSTQVKQMAQMMVDAHTMTTDELKARLVRAGLIVETPTMLDDAHKQKLEQLRGANNQQFDQMYLDLQKEAHDEALMVHRDYAMNGDMADLKAFAADTVPKIEMHRMMIAELEENANKGKLSKN